VPWRIQRFIPFNRLLGPSEASRAGAFINANIPQTHRSGNCSGTTRPFADRVSIRLFHRRGQGRETCGRDDTPCERLSSSRIPAYHRVLCSRRMIRSRLPWLEPFIAWCQLSTQRVTRTFPLRDAVLSVRGRFPQQSLFGHSMFILRCRTSCRRRKLSACFVIDRF
jgi:hypothetical protein